MHTRTALAVLDILCVPFFLLLLLYVHGVFVRHALVANPAQRERTRNVKNDFQLIIVCSVTLIVRMFLFFSLATNDNDKTSSNGKLHTKGIMSLQYVPGRSCVAVAPPNYHGEEFARHIG